MAEGTGLDDGSCSAATLAPALAAWRARGELAAALADPEALRLVLAADGAAIRDATEAGRRLVRLLGRAEALPAALAAQIVRGAGPIPRLLRLRLDPRGVAPPTLCRLARAEDADGHPVFLLVVAGPLPNLRPPPARQEAEDPQTPLLPLPAVGRRFLWRTDAEGTLTQISDGQDALSRLAGQSWEALIRAGRIGGDARALLDALSNCRTFRATTIDLGLGKGRRATVDLSGAPSARAGQTFAGFAGFGIVRDGRSLGRADTPAPGAGTAPAGPAEPPAPAPSPATTPAPLPSNPIALATMAAPIFAAWLGQTWFGDPSSRGGSASPEPTRPTETVPAGTPEIAAAETAAPVIDSLEPAPAEPAPAEPAPAEPAPAEPASAEPAPAEPAPGEPGPPEPASPEAAAPALAAADPEPGAPSGDPADSESEAESSGPSEPGLSLTEHAAFREIARALGARYAGDEDRPADDAESRGAGSVTPFPGGRPAPAPEPGAILDGIPGAVLVHRGGAILAANGSLLALSGYPDLAALKTAGLERLFRGLPPERHAEAGDEAVTLAIEAADGTGRPVALTRAAMAWPGGPAECLLLRPLTVDDPQGRGAAEDLARRVREARGADALAALDALEDGLAVLDRAGRILALNRAAAALFACDPREVVGGAFASLFAPEGEAAQAVLDAVLDAAAGEGTVAVAGRSLALRVVPLAGDRRVAVLRPGGPAEPSGAAAFASGFLATLDRGIRTPLTGILGFAEVMLKEPYGPLGHARYRAYLQDVRASGEQVLGLVSDLIDLATVEAGGLALDRRILPLNDLIASCVADLQPAAARGRIVLRTSFAQDLAPLEADEASLLRAVRIVIANAIRLSGAGGQVIVSTGQAEAGALAVRVRDTGAGLGPDEIAFALQPFSGEAGLRAEIGGGLGLPLMRALVAANDGALHISSRKDEGTLVEIRLPAARAARRA